MRLLILLLSISAHLGTMSQVTFGSIREPDKDVLLDLKENDYTSSKGLLLPRVELKTLNDPYPLNAHIEGMLVYNTKNNLDNSITQGLYRNNGNKWVRVQLPDGGTEGQFLAIDEETSLPKWKSLYIPTSEEFYLVAVGGFRSKTGAILRNNNGSTVYEENSLIDNTWYDICEPIEVTSASAKNRIIITVQTTILQDYYSGSGLVSYAGAIFVNQRLKGVRMNSILSSGSNDDIFKTETLFFIVEDLTIGNNTLRICFKRRVDSSVTNPLLSTFPPLYIGRDLGARPGSTSILFKYYEK